MKNVSVFLPVRRGSERVINKNTKPFAGFSGGLLELKLEQLLKINADEIILSTNDPKAIKIANKYTNGESRLKIIERPEHLALSSTDLSDLIAYAPSVCSYPHILWTHVTSPFLDTKRYDHVIKIYFEQLENGYDSLMTAKIISSFIWDQSEQKVINTNSDLQWPRTQDLKVMHEIDSGIFMQPKKAYDVLKNRIGLKPYIYETNPIESIDVDWAEDFKMAEKLYKAFENDN